MTKGDSRDRMVAGFTAISAYHQYIYEFESRSWWSVLDTTSGDKVCHWIATGRQFPPRYNGNIVKSGIRHHKTKEKKKNNDLQNTTQDNLNFEYIRRIRDNCIKIRLTFKVGMCLKIQSLRKEPRGFEIWQFLWWGVQHLRKGRCFLVYLTDSSIKTFEYTTKIDCLDTLF